MKSSEKSNDKKENKFWVRLLCWILAGVMVLGLGYTTVYFILSSIGIL